MIPLRDSTLSDDQRHKLNVSLLRKGALTSPLHGANYSYMVNNLREYSSFYHTKHFELITKNFRANQKTIQNLEVNSNYLGNWQSAIKHAWEYEKFDIQLGGKGSENWSRAERAEILKSGRLKRFKNSKGKWDSAVGHHRSNKYNHPYAQSDAHNIRFCRNREQHLREEHGGDFHNETDGKWINRDEMVKSTYRRGVVKRELYSAGVAAAIGFVSSAAISLVLEITENGLDRDSFKSTLINAGKQGLPGARDGLLYYGGLRGGSLVLDKIATGMPLSTKTVQLLKANGCKIAVIGGVIIAVDVVSQTSRGMQDGRSFMESVGNSLKTQILPTTLLGLSVWQPHIGVAASVAAVTYEVWRVQHDRYVLAQVELQRLTKLYDSIREKYQM